MRPGRIIRGVDYQGFTCGKSTGYESRPYAAWVMPNPFIQGSYEIKVCVSQCTDTALESLTDNARTFLIPHTSKKSECFCVAGFECARL